MVSATGTSLVLRFINRVTYCRRLAPDLLPFGDDIRTEKAGLGARTSRPHPTPLVERRGGRDARAPSHSQSLRGERLTGSNGFRIRWCICEMRYLAKMRASC